MAKTYTPPAPRLVGRVAAAANAVTQIAALTAGGGITANTVADERGAGVSLVGQDTVWIAFVAMEHGTGTTIVDTTPTGWTKIGEVSGVTTRVSMGVYYRVPVESEFPISGSSSPTATSNLAATFGYSGGGSNTDDIGVIIVAVNNVDTSNPIAASATSSGTTTTSLQTPSVTPTADGQSILNFLFVGEDTGTTFGVADATSPVTSLTTTAGTDCWIGASMSAGVGVSGVARQVSAGTVFSTLWQQCAIVLRTAPARDGVAFIEAGLPGTQAAGAIDVPGLTSTTAEGGELDTTDTYLFAYGYGAGSTKTVDSGWTDAGLNNVNGFRVQYRKRDGTASDDPSSNITSGAGASRTSGQAFALKNVNTADPIGAVTSISGTGTTPTIPQMAVNTGDVVVYIVGQATNSLVPATMNMSGAHLHAGNSGSSGIGTRTSMFFTQRIAVGGTSPALTGPTWAASVNWAVYAFVVQVAPSIAPLTAEFVVGDTELDTIVEPFQGNTFLGPTTAEVGEVAVEVAGFTTFKPRRRPRRATIWLYGLDGQRKAALR